MPSLVGSEMCIRDRGRTILHLVEEDECVTCFYPERRIDEGEVPDNAIYLVTFFEDCLVFLLQYEVDGNNILIVVMGEMKDGSGLSHLSGSLHDEGHSLLIAFPFLEIIINLSAQKLHNQYVYSSYSSAKIQLYHKIPKEFGLKITKFLLF